MKKDPKLNPTVTRAVNGAFTALGVWFWIVRIVVVWLMFV